MSQHDVCDLAMRAIVLAEGALGKPMGKTATGLVLHSVDDAIVAVIDSTAAGEDAGEVVAGRRLGIPVVGSYKDAKAHGADRLYVGVANIGGFLPPTFRGVIRDALADGLEVVSGLHVFLGDDPEFSAAATAGGGRIHDVRRPPTELRVADGSIQSRTTPRLLVMGMDCDLGKRITAVQLLRVARGRGLDAGFVATGQTGCMLGADAGAVIDRIPADFAAGHVERMMCQVSDTRRDLVIAYGQASVQHPAFGGVALAVLQGAAPHAVVLQVAPARRHRVLFESSPFPMGDLVEEIDLIERLGRTRVVALAVNNAGVADAGAAIRDLERITGLPAVDPLYGDASALFDAAWDALGHAPP